MFSERSSTRTKKHSHCKFPQLIEGRTTEVRATDVVLNSLGTNPDRRIFFLSKDQLLPSAFCRRKETMEEKSACQDLEWDPLFTTVQ